MTDTRTTTPAGPSSAPGRRPQADVAPIRVAEQGLAQDLRAVKVVLARELIRFRQDKIRMVSALVQPVLFIFVLGTGLSTLTGRNTGGLDLKTFMFPGIMATSVLFTAMFSAMSIVWDREFGFLREMLVAPVRRGSIIVGKALGGAVVATLQGLLVLALAGLVHVPYHPVMILALIGEVFLLAFTLCALGLVLAARIQQMQTMMGLMQMILLPLSFLSGSMYPINGLPQWLKTMVMLNPVTYAVHPVRSTVFHYLDAPEAAKQRLNPPLTWFGWTVPAALQLALVVVLGLGLLAVAAREFSKVE